MREIVLSPYRSTALTRSPPGWRVRPTSPLRADRPLRAPREALLQVFRRVLQAPGEIHALFHVLERRRDRGVRPRDALDRMAGAAAEFADERLAVLRIAAGGALMLGQPRVAAGETGEEDQAAERRNHCEPRKSAASG